MERESLWGVDSKRRPNSEGKADIEIKLIIYQTSA